MNSAPPVDTVPRGPLRAAGVLVVTSLLAVAAVRVSGIDIRAPDAAAVQTRALRFADLPDGGIAVVDAALGRHVSVITGEQGFLRGALRALARERRLRGLDGHEPFLLIGRADGRLTLQDPMTGQRIDLESFGPLHAGAFARLLAAAPRTPAGATQP